MSYYYRLGEVPHKRHTQFRQPDGPVLAKTISQLVQWIGRFKSFDLPRCFACR